MEPANYALFFAQGDSPDPIWSVELDDIELLAGMLAGSVGIISDLNQNDAIGGYYLDCDADISSYRLAAEISEYDIKNKIVVYLEEGQFGVWLKGERRSHYGLYVFQTNSFFQGFVSICNTFEVDFRDYLYGYPFDRNGDLYIMSNYVMVPYNIVQDAFDLDDLEAEEADDENIIEILHRTDDIITLKD